MTDLYSEETLSNIAKECQEFEHIISAMGYGYSFLNVSPDNFTRICSDCVNWLGGSCDIFQSELRNRN